jgi:acyl-CoA reductase-like NAD-dependent aldehyde dehydrogenase
MAKVVKLQQPTVLRSFDPRTGDAVAEVLSATPDEVRDAVGRARAAQPAWAELGVEGRYRELRKVARAIHEQMDDIVRTVSAETGKPEAEALSHDVLPTLLTITYLGRIAPKALRPQRIGRVVAPLLGFRSRIEWRPFGVVGCISPWNYPLYLSFMAVVPALLAGNTVVLKPSEVTPATGEWMREVLGALPKDVAIVVQGTGEVGGALVDAPCDKLCFIGSTETGRKIAEAAAKHLTPMIMELGGQDSAIVCADADLDVASSGILWGAFLNAGQTCTAIERVYVVEDVADQFVTQVVSKLGELEALPEPQIGPLSIERQFEVVDRHVRDAVERGAKVLTGGPAQSGDGARGSLRQAPTVLEGRAEGMAMFAEETFGPVLPIVRVKDEREAIRRTNEEGYNLTASVWSTDSVKARAIASRLKAGTVSINDHAAAAGAPWGIWGGVGDSGYGRLQGALGLREFTVPVHIAMSTLPRTKKVWWYPYDRPTVEALRSLVDFLGSEGVAEKAKAVRSIVPNALRAMRRKI